MLTKEGYEERKWHRYPNLRKILEEKKIPSYYYGPTSASDNSFDAASRLHHLAVLICENTEEIIACSPSYDRVLLIGDLHQVREEILNLRRELGRYIEGIDNICRWLEEKGRKIELEPQEGK